MLQLVKKDTQADKKFLDGQVAKAKADVENKNTILASAVKATDIKVTGIDKNVTYEVSISKQDDKTQSVEGTFVLTYKGIKSKVKSFIPFLALKIL